MSIRVASSAKTSSPAAASGVERWNVAGAPLRLRDELRDLVRYRWLLRRLVHRDLTVRYKRSALGFVWTMLHPLILVGIMTLVFSTIFRFSIRNYPAYFLSAWVAWSFFSQTLIEAMTSLRWNGTMMKQVRLPRSIFVVATTVSGVVHMALALAAVLLIMGVTGVPIRPSILFVPVSVLILGVFTLGIAMIASTLAVFFGDVKEMIQAFLPAVMYLTPVIYPLSIIPAAYLPLITANPLAHLVELLRAPLYAGTIPGTFTLAVSCVSALIALIAGWLVFGRFSPRFYGHL